MAENVEKNSAIKKVAAGYQNAIQIQNYEQQMAQYYADVAQEQINREYKDQIAADQYAYQNEIIGMRNAAAIEAFDKSQQTYQNNINSIDFYAQNQKDRIQLGLDEKIAEIGFAQSDLDNQFERKLMESAYGTAEYQQMYDTAQALEGKELGKLNNQKDLLSSQSGQIDDSISIRNSQINQISNNQLIKDVEKGQIDTDINILGQQRSQISDRIKIKDIEKAQIDDQIKTKDLQKDQISSQLGVKDIEKQQIDDEIKIKSQQRGQVDNQISIKDKEIKQLQQQESSNSEEVKNLKTDQDINKVEQTIQQRQTDQLRQDQQKAQNDKNYAFLQAEIERVQSTGAARARGQKGKSASKQFNALDAVISLNMSKMTDDLFYSKAALERQRVSSSDKAGLFDKQNLKLDRNINIKGFEKSQLGFSKDIKGLEKSSLKTDKQISQIQEDALTKGKSIKDLDKASLQIDKAIADIEKLSLNKNKDIKDVEKSSLETDKAISLLQEANLAKNKAIKDIEKDSLDSDKDIKGSEIASLNKDKNQLAIQQSNVTLDQDIVTIKAGDTKATAERNKDKIAEVLGIDKKELELDQEKLAEQLLSEAEASQISLQELESKTFDAKNQAYEAQMLAPKLEPLLPAPYPTPQTTFVEPKPPVKFPKEAAGMGVGGNAGAQPVSAVSSVLGIASTVAGIAAPFTGGASLAVGAAATGLGFLSSIFK